MCSLLALVVTQEKAVKEKAPSDCGLFVVNEEAVSHQPALSPDELKTSIVEVAFAYHAQC
jgi:hypothetical protein